MEFHFRFIGHYVKFTGMSLSGKNRLNLSCAWSATDDYLMCYRLNVVLVNTAVICCWLMWAIVWLAQWKPLINPVLKAEGE